MTDLSRWLSGDDLPHIKLEEQLYLTSVFEQLDGFPTLDQLWRLVDEPWHKLNCDPNVMDERVASFYAHPVWLLNGLFTEQHAQSRQNRECFTKWVVQQSPKRVGDYGGGFGSLARMIGEACPTAEVEIIEPHPHPLAVAKADKTENVRYRNELSGEYDILISTDVFEHVPDPLGLVAACAERLSTRGSFLIANCFYPVIKCHLPNTFHFRYSWNYVMRALGFDFAGPLLYGSVYTKKTEEINLRAARVVEQRSKKFWSLSKWLPGSLARLIAKFFIESRPHESSRILPRRVKP